MTKRKKQQKKVETWGSTYRTSLGGYFSVPPKENKKQLYYKKTNLILGTLNFLLCLFVLMVPLLNIFILYQIVKDSKDATFNNFSEFIGWTSWEKCKTKEEIKWE